MGHALTVSRELAGDFENSIEELDFVAAVNQQPHVYGARLTGGGFGGAVMAFTSESFSMKAEAVATASRRSSVWRRR